eukprot:scaffold47026_cov113-Cyclotella_meneghiniana.AAC.4
MGPELEWCDACQERLSPRRSNGSIGSGYGWHARIGRDRHSSGHGLMVIDDDENQESAPKVVRLQIM